jgi:hypothetical protein
MKISLFDSKIGGNWKRAQRYSQIFVQPAKWVETSSLIAPGPTKRDD